MLELENAPVNTPPPDPEPPASAVSAKTMRITEDDVRSKLLLPYSQFGEYTVLTHLGTGGMGIVYGALHRGLNRRVALKVMRSGPLATPVEVDRFRRESEAAAKLNHPNIVPIFEIGQHAECAFFSMQYVAGQTLSELNAATKDRDPAWMKTCAGIMAQVARAVQHAHEHLVLHRDLKPGNILLDEEGNPHVTDFGIAKLLQSGEQHTLTDTILGTPEYMSPEQAAGISRDITTAADIFSLGAVMYHLLTGKHAFKGSTPLETIQQVVNRTPVSLRKIHPAVPRDLEVICLKCLEKEPAHRYSAAALADELERWLAGRPIISRPANPVERAWKWARRNPKLASAIGSAIVILAVGALGWRTAVREAQEKTRMAKEKTQANERLEVQRAEGFFAEENSSEALASLARALRDNASNRVAGWRLINALNYRQFLVPIRSAGAGVTAASFTGDGSLLITGTNAQGAVITLRRGDSSPVEFNHGARQVLAARLTSDGRWLVSGSEDGLRIWSAGSGLLAGHPVTGRPVHFVALLRLPEGEAVAAVTTDAVVLSSVDGSVPAREIPAGHNDVMLAAQSADHRSLALATESGHILVRDLTRDGEWLVIKAHTKVIRALSFSTDDRLVSGSADKTARVWNLRTGKEELVLPCEGTVGSAEFRHDNRMLITGTRSEFMGLELCLAHLRDALTGNLSGSVMKHPGWVNAARFSPDGRYAITACDDGVLRLWSTTGARLLAKTVSSGQALTEAAFSADGQSILSVGNGGVATIYGRIDLGGSQPMQPDPASMKYFPTKAVELPANEMNIYRLRHAAEVTFTDISPDGTLAATASADRTARVWKRATGQPFSEPLLHDAPVNCARFSADGALLVTSTSSRKVRVWDALTGLPITDWIEAHYAVSQVWLSPNLGYVITDQREAWPLQWSREPAPMWLPELAEAIAGVSLKEGREVNTALVALRERFAQNSETNGLPVWATKLFNELPTQFP